jgi:serine/threonine protein phosphatase 1
MSKTYAIADLHGRLDLLEIALGKIADHADLPGTVVTLGDYVDRGPHSRQVIERLMGGLGREGWRLICLKGNHEDIMWQTCLGMVLRLVANQRRRRHANFLRASSRRRS